MTNLGIKQARWKKSNRPCIDYMILRSQEIQPEPDQFAPFGSTFAIRFRNDGEYTNSGEQAGFVVVDTGTFTDVQIGDADADTVRFKCSSLGFYFRLGSRRSVDHIPVIVENGIACVFIGLCLCVGQNTVSAQLGLAVLPSFTHTVITRGQLFRIAGSVAFRLRSSVPIAALTACRKPSIV